jgi:hypothetical protein
VSPSRRVSRWLLLLLLMLLLVLRRLLRLLLLLLLLLLLWCLVGRGGTLAKLLNHFVH